MTTQIELREIAVKQLSQLFFMHSEGQRQVESIAESLIENQLQIFRHKEVKYDLNLVLSEITASIDPSMPKSKMALLMKVLKRKLSERYRINESDPNDSFNKSAEYFSNYISSILEQTLKNYEHIKPEDIHFRLTSICLFSATLGGLSNSSSIKALITQLIHEEKPLKKAEGIVYIELILKSSDHETNERNDKGEKVTLKRWYPDVLSLSAIHGFLSIKGLVKELEVEPKIIYQNLLKQCRNTSKLRNLSLPILLEACALYSFRHPQSGLSFCLKNYATGLISSASVSRVSFERLNSTFTLTQTSNKAVSVSSELRPSAYMQKIKSNSSTTSFSNQEFTKEILLACKDKTRDGHLRNQKDALFSLSQIRAKYDYMPHAAEIFEAWVSHNLFSSNWVNATAERYITAICEAWLNSVGDQDLREGDGADTQSLYEHIVSVRACGDTRAPEILKYLFIYAHEKFNVRLPDSFASNEKGATHVRSQIISENHFQKLRKDFNARFCNESKSTLESIDIALVLCRRLFLRPSEAFRLLVKDVEYSEECWIRVRANCWRSLKTYNSGRKIPVKTLLLEEEFIRFRAFIEQRRFDTGNRENALLFSLLQSADVAFCVEQISKQVGELLTSYIGEPVRFYSLRHTGISNMQLTLCADDDTNQQYNYYSLGKIEEIKKYLSCNDSDKYYQISKLAGHLSPSITLSTYAHFTDRLLYDALKNINRSLNPETWCRILNLRPSIIRKAFSKDNTNLCVTTSNIKSIVLKRVGSFCKNQIGKSEAKSAFLSMPPPKICFNVISTLKVLQKFDEGRSAVEISWEVPIPLEIIESVISAAQAIKNRYVTNRGEYRLYPAKSEKLTPSQPPSTIEKSDYERMVRVLELQSISDTSLKHVIHYVLDNISIDHPGITFKTLAQLKAFMFGLGDVIEPKNLHVSLTPLHSKEDECVLYWSKVIQREICLLPQRKKNKNLFPNGQLSIQYVRPDHENLKAKYKGKLAINKYGSNSLRCALHMIAIVLGAKRRLSGC